MKFLIQLITIVCLSWLFQLVLPWWSIALAAFIVSFFYNNRGSAAFAAGFFAVAILWFAFAIVLDLKTHSILSAKMVQLFPLPESPFSLLAVTALTGGLVGGIGAITGNRLRKIF